MDTHRYYADHAGDKGSHESQRQVLHGLPGASLGGRCACCIGSFSGSCCLTASPPMFATAEVFSLLAGFDGRVGSPSLLAMEGLGWLAISSSWEGLTSMATVPCVSSAAPPWTAVCSLEPLGPAGSCLPLAIGCAELDGLASRWGPAPNPAPSSVGMLLIG